MRILALDWGTVRVGVAISDPDGTIAFAWEHPLASNNAIAEIKKIVIESEIKKILVGIPKSLSGDDNQSSKAATEFVEKLQQNINCEIKLVDERFSSIGAQKILRMQGLGDKQQRGMVDNIAAQQMLQTYLDNQN